MTLIIGHNLPFDLPRLEAAGVKWRHCELHDTMVGHSVLYPELAKSLNSTASMALDVERWKHLRAEEVQTRKCRLRKRRDESEEAFAGRREAWHAAQAAQLDLHVEENEAREEVYNRKDSHHDFEIAVNQRRALARTGQLGLFQTMMRALPYLIDMHTRGLAVDLWERQRLLQKCARRRDIAWRLWRDVSGGAEPNSWPQVHAVLYDRWGLPRQFKDAKDGEGHNVTADNEALENLLEMLPERHPNARGIKALQLFRDYDKRIGYLAKLEQVAHPSYAPLSKDDAEPGRGGYRFGAATGRIIAHDPPIQAWEKPMRRLFVPHDRKRRVLLALDYSQQELWIQAWLARDEALFAALRSGHVHKLHAEMLGVDRTRAKNVVYGTIFRGGARAVQHQCKMRGFKVPLEFIEEAQAKIQKRYWRTMVWGDALLEQTRELGYVVNPFMRRRYFYSVRGVFNEIVNFPVQSTGADMLWELIPELARTAAAWGGELLATIHDEALFEVPREVVPLVTLALKRVMERVFPQVAPAFFVPVAEKQGVNWYEMAEFKAAA